MNKKMLILPVAMLMLAACGGGSPSASDSESSPDSTTLPSVSTEDTATPPSVSTGDTATPPSVSTGDTATPPSVSTGDTATPPSTSTSTSEGVVPVVATIEQVQAVAMSLASNGVSNDVYTVEGTITGVVGRSYHIQEGDFGIFVYQGTSSEATPAGFEVGKKIRVTAYATNFNGLPQLAYKNKYAIQEEIIGEGDVVTPLQITSLDLSAQTLASRLVTIEGLTYVSGTHKVDTSSRNNIKFKLADTEIYCYVDKTIENTLETEIATMLSGFTANETVVTYTGNLAYNSSYGGLNIMPANASNFVVA